jgi:integrase
MATIYEIPGKKRPVYRVQVRLKGSRPATATFARKTDAKRWAAEVETDIKAGRYFKTAEAKQHTLQGAIDRYIREVHPLRPRSMKDRNRHLLWWRDRLGYSTLADVTPQVLSICREELAAGETVRGQQRSPSTVNRYLATLSHVFSVVVREWEWADDNPCRRVTKRREPRGRVRYLSEEERGRLLGACLRSKNRRLYPLVLLALSTGARCGELLRLRWADVDTEKGVAIVHESKNDERRALAITGPALSVLRDLRGVRRPDSDLVFVTSRGAATFPQRSWTNALRTAGIDDFRFHDLRHSTASYLAMSGATLAEIAEVLGHRTLAMVKRYSHLSADHVLKVVAKMTDAFLMQADGAADPLPEQGGHQDIIDPS